MSLLILFSGRQFDFLMGACRQPLLGNAVVIAEQAQFILGKFGVEKGGKGVAVNWLAKALYAQA